MRALSDMIEHLERQLLDYSVRTSPEAAGALLASEFREFGKSGTVYDRAAILSCMEKDKDRFDFVIDSFRVEQLGPESVLATYRITVSRTGLADSCSLRSSIWRLDMDKRWRMLFHQGTKTQ